RSSRRKEAHFNFGFRISDFGFFNQSLLTSAATLIEESAHRLLDDVFDDVGGRVINAAGFLDFRFFLNNRAMAFRQPDDFAEKLLIDLSENVRRQRGKDIGAFWVVKAFENVPQELVVEIEAKGEFVGRFV